MMHARSLGRKLDLRSVELRSLIELGQVLNSSLDADAVLNTCLLTPMGRMLISRGMALTVLEDGSFGARILKGLPKSLAEERYSFAYSFRAPTLLADLPDEVCRYKSFFQSFGIELVVPMCSPSRMVGALCFGGKMNGLPFSPRELEFLNSLSNIAATALENALMFQSLMSVNRRLDRKVHELNTLFEIGKELNAAFDRQRILTILQHTIMGQMAVNKLIMVEAREDEIDFPIVRWSERGELELLMKERELTVRLLQMAEARVLEPEEMEYRPLVAAGVCAVVPMRLQEETRAALLLGRRLSRLEYTQEDLDFLSTLGNRVMVSLENVRLFDEALEKQRLEEEMAIAESIQQRLLPSTFPSLPGVEIYGLNRPSRVVGGDYFDFMPLSSGRVALAIGDVSGKGLGAALLMSNLHAGLHALLQIGLPMNELIARLNNLIYRNTDFDKFITFFYAELDTESRVLQYINAGHNPPMLCRWDGSIELLDKGGLILGMLEDADYEIGRVELRSGDLLATYTDGVTEARNAKDELFEDDRLAEMVKEAVRHHLRTDELCDRIVQAVEEFAGGFPQVDDITLLVVKIE